MYSAFLLLRAGSVGVKAAMIPLMLVIMNLSYSLTTYPVGPLSDRYGRTGLMISGLTTLVFSHLILCFGETGLWVATGTALWGIHMGLTQGLLAEMVADTAGERLRGTAFGIFGMASGVAMLFSCLSAGWLWDLRGPQATFLAGAFFAFTALGGYLSVLKRFEGALANLHGSHK